MRTSDALKLQPGTFVHVRTWTSKTVIPLARVVQTGALLGYLRECALPDGRIITNCEALTGGTAVIVDCGSGPQPLTAIPARMIAGVWDDPGYRAKAEAVRDEALRKIEEDHKRFKAAQQAKDLAERKVLDRCRDLIGKKAVSRGIRLAHGEIRMSVTTLKRLLDEVSAGTA